MDNALINSPNAVVADYKPQHLPQFKNNPMIEALPAAMNDEELFEAMTLLPDFSPEQRGWSTQDRIQMILTLSSFMIPLRRHVQLARSLDSMLRAGYQGRVPKTPEHAKRLQKTYEAKKSQGPSAMSILESNPQLSTLLMGVSGMGKTTSVKRFFANIPQVIYHPEHNLYQVTYLHVEMPSDGASINGLAHGILHQLDKLIPGANYYEEYTKVRTSSDALMRGVARLMNQHFVGFLIADEIQNLANAYKGKQTVMTELVSACNELGVPILFVGTNKAAEVFSLDFRKSRRACGHGVEHWDRLFDDAEAGQVSEWHEFLAILWAFQWVRKPCDLNVHFVLTMYYLCQGVIDIAIKLFASAQARAIANDTECITTELLVDVYEKELGLLHPMIDALRDSKVSDLVAFPDIAPVGTEDLVKSAQRKVRTKTSDAYGVKSGDPTFVPSIAAALVATGVNEDDALEAAEKVAKDGKPRNLIQGTQQALKFLTASTQKPRSKPKSGEDGEPDNAGDVYAPESYQRAIAQAQKDGSKTYEHLQRFGMAKPLDELLDLT